MNYYYSNVYNHEGKKELFETNTELAAAPVVTEALAPVVAEVTAPVVNNIDPETVSTDPLANPY